MAASLAHAHRVPHTVKSPARCPHCGSGRLIRKGTRRKKLEIAQLWQCKLCRRVFTPAPPSLRYKTYLAHVREDERHKRFAPLADFLERVPDICPHDLFSESSRASQLPNFIDRNHLVVVDKENFATRTAALVLPAVGDNRLRHETLQRFMLANDSVTVAVEIPIWLTAADIDALEVEHDIRLLPPDHSPRALTGHIDFLQVRNNAVHILDYKPDARTNKPIAQLTLYAIALTRLAGLRLFDIKCAWFNEEEYCEFFPRALLARQN
jgi:ribosomal protein L37AE/L43A